MADTEGCGRIRLALSDGVYWLARLAGAWWRPKLVGADQLPHEPAIYIANHAAANGPIAVVLAVPVRLHPWITDRMLHHRSAPRYLYADLAGPVWGMSEPLGRVVCAIIGHLAVLFLRSLCPVAVRPENGLLDDCFAASLSLLGQGRSVLIFPENPSAPPDPRTGLRPFSSGFAWLCSLYLRLVGEELALVPLAYHVQSNSVHVLTPFRLHRADLDNGGVRRLQQRAESAIIEDLARE